MVNCPVCNGPGFILGRLVTAWYRCRDCGTTFMDDAIDQDTGWGDNTTPEHPLDIFYARAIGLID